MDSSAPETATPTDMPPGSVLRKTLDTLKALDSAGFLILHHWGKGPNNGRTEFRFEVPDAGEAPFYGLSGPQVDAFLMGVRAAYRKLGAELPAGL